MSRKRQYLDVFLESGFYFTGSKENPSPICLICERELSNGSMKGNHLRRHLLTKHPDNANKGLDFFTERLRLFKLRKLESVQDIDSEETIKNFKEVEASFKISLLIAKEGKAHSIGESLIKPAIMEAVSTLCDTEFVEKFKDISLSHQTVGRRIQEMSENVEQNLIARLQKSDYLAIQVDESTDISGLSQMLVFVRYVFEEEIHEDLLFCKEIEIRATSQAMFDIFVKYFSENNLDWTKVIGICTDGAPAMVGAKEGLVVKMKRVAPHLKWYHCFIHREALASKLMPVELKEVFNIAVKTVNLIKTRPVKSRLFRAICESIGSNYYNLLLYTEVRWLSRGKFLSRLFELREEIFLFLNVEGSELKDYYSDIYFVEKLAYLSDIFDILYELNIGSQGNSLNIFHLSSKVMIMKQMFDTYILKIRENDITFFPKLDNYLKRNNFSLGMHLKILMVSHISQLKYEFNRYFPRDQYSNEWVMEPFSQKAGRDINSSMHEQFINFIHDEPCRHMFLINNLDTFWIKMKNKYPVLFHAAMQTLLPFATTYTCEQGFSSMIYIKNKYRSRLHLEESLRLKLSKISPNIKELVAKKQLHTSH